MSNSEQLADQTDPILRVLFIWKEILKRSDIGVNDCFLDVGGDSLAAMLCISRLRSDFNVEFSLEDFFVDGATVADLSQKIAELLNQPDTRVD